ncbi:hypothetical protein M422DRAFT_256270 [Sphaerobolus stellatus SS14]|uniref:Uncharacterized protein n=1 Tax=Sphaerobolus stellatus (strain SS14) TaxID=990650 RepID=A0A0C9UCK4_SPHS4|nr:hypothetical protein M422DRAFT_256270 [Sphaerobolus stellatus SS14]
MSARTQQVQFVPATPIASAPFFPATALGAAPLFPATAIASTPYFPGASQSPVIVPCGQASARTFPAIVAGNGPFTSYPPEHGRQDEDERLLYTYASFHEEPVAALCSHNDTWNLRIAVPIPSINNPTLLALRYLIKYATTGDDGSSTIQTDTILTVKTLPEGVVTANTDIDVYKNKTGYAPRMVDHDTALCLSTTLAIKGNGGGEQWSHYVDNQHITPNVRVYDGSHLYLVFHVCEYPTAEMARSLSVEVSATWQKEEVEKKAKAEAERKAKEEAEQKAKEEAERKAREAEERQAREEERAERQEAKAARDEERIERQKAETAREEIRVAIQEAKAAREEEKRAREAAKAPPAPPAPVKDVAAAPAVADDAMQTHIAETIKKLGLEPCPAGYEYKKTAEGYVCSAGGHKISFEQLAQLKTLADPCANIEKPTASESLIIEKELGSKDILLHHYERYAWLVMIAIFIMMLSLDGKAGYNFNAQKSLKDPAGLRASDVLSYGAIMFSAPASLAPMYADYNCCLPPKASKTKGFMLTFFGVLIGMMIITIIGALLMAVPNYSDAYVAGGPGMVLSKVAVDFLPPDSTALSMQALLPPFRQVLRPFWVIITFAMYTAICVAGREHSGQLE